MQFNPILNRCSSFVKQISIRLVKCDCLNQCMSKVIVHLVQDALHILLAHLKQRQS